VAELESQVLSENIPASCQELADRGETTNGIYNIQPSADLSPFEVKCVFRNLGSNIYFL